MKNDSLAAEFARTLRHLHRMEGTIHWSPEGLWVLNGEIVDDQNTRRALFRSCQPQQPTPNTWQECLQQPDKVLINQGRLARWSFDLRSLPDAKTLEALHQTGTAPLRKYRDSAIDQMLAQMHARQQLLQRCFLAWQALSQTPKEQKITPSIELLTLLSQSLSPNAKGVMDAITGANQTIGQQLLALLKTETTHQITALLLCLLATNKAIRPLDIPPPWRSAWKSIKSTPGLFPISTHQIPIIWTYLTHTKNAPENTTLAWLGALPSQIHESLGATVTLLSITLSPAQAWDVFERQAALWTIEIPIDVRPAQDRIDEFTYVLTSITRGDAPGGRFEDIALHKSLTATEGPHNIRARYIVEQLATWLGDHRWLLEQPGVQRHLTKDIARDLQEGWEQVTLGLKKRWKLILQQASALTKQSDDDAKDLTRKLVQAMLMAVEAWISHAPQTSRTKKRKKPKPPHIPETEAQQYCDEEDEEDTPAPFVPHVPEAIAHLLKRPAPSEVPMDRLGWTEWLWHRSWQLTPGARATLWCTLQDSQFSPYGEAASYHLHHYQPILAAESPMETKYSRMHPEESSLDRIQQQTGTPGELHIALHQLLRSCPLDPQAVIALQAYIQRQLEIGAYKSDHPPREYWLFAPVATMLCQPDEAFGIIQPLHQVMSCIAEAAASQEDGLGPSIDPDKWAKVSFEQWKMSLIRSGEKANIKDLLQSKEPLFQMWGVEAASLWLVPETAPILRKMLRKASTLKEKEKLALALGFQAQSEAQWPLIVLLRRHPESLALLVAIERCATQKVRQEAFQIWTPPILPTDLLHPDRLHLSMESRCPSLQEQLCLFVMEQAESLETSKSALAEKKIYQALWVLACQDSEAPHFQEAMGSFIRYCPQALSLGIRESFTHVAGDYEECLRLHRKKQTFLTLREPQNWDRLRMWLESYQSIAHLLENPTRPPLPPPIEHMIWRYLWTSQENRGLDTIIDLLLGHSSDPLWSARYIALALRERGARLSQESCLRLAQQLVSYEYDLSARLLGIECVLAAPDPQALCESLMDGYHEWNPAYEVMFWCALERPNTPLAKFVELCLARKHTSDNMANFLTAGIDVLEAWLPPERAAIHLTRLVEMWYQHQKHLGQSDREILSRLMCNEALEVYDGRWSSWHCASYRVQSMIIQKAAPCLVREECQALAAEIRACYHPREEHPRIRWFLEQLDVVVS